MTTLTQGARPWSFVLSEANGLRSRERGTLRSGQNLAAGTVLQWYNGVALGSLVAFTSASLSSSGVPAIAAVGILGQAVDASAGDVQVAYLARDAEVNKHQLVYPAETTAGGEAAATFAGLAAAGIIAR